MNRKQENKFRMYKTVEKVCNDNNAVWSAHVAFSNAFDAFVVNNNAIDNTVDEQETDNRGITTDKTSKKQVMAEKTVEISGAGIAYASINDNEELLQKLNYSFSEIFYASDVTAHNRAEIVYNETNNLLAELVDFGMDAGKLGEFEVLINEYKALLVKQSSTGDETQTQTSNLVELFNDNDTVLKERMDKLMPQFKTISPDFYSTYFNAREIIDLGGSPSPENDEEPPPVEP